MSEDAPTTRSSVLYGLGKLAAETAAHGQEIARLREANEEIPARVIAGLAPQLASIQGTLSLHDRRIGTLERRQWLVWGGGATVLALATYAIEFVKLR